MVFGVAVLEAIGRPGNKCVSQPAVENRAVPGLDFCGGDNAPSPANRRDMHQIKRLGRGVMPGGLRQLDQFPF